MTSNPMVQEGIPMIPRFYLGFVAAVLSLLAVADQKGFMIESFFSGNYSPASRSTAGQFHK